MIFPEIAKEVSVKKLAAMIFLAMRRHPHPVFTQLPDTQRLTKSDRDRKLLAMQRAFVSAGTPFILPPGTPPDKVQILREAMRKTFSDPEFHTEFRKLVGEELTPLTSEELEKAVRDLPRDREVVELFNKLSGADALPPRQWTVSLCRFA
jgi:cytochrome P450